MFRQFIKKTLYLLKVRQPLSIWLPAQFSDGMVLQQQSEAPIWGKAEPDSSLTITADWLKESFSVTVTSHGLWHAKLPTPKAGGPFTLTMTDGHQRKQLKNILIGEVWLCSGQSNMEWSANMGIENGRLEIEAANHPNIRFFNVERNTSDTPLDRLTGKWQICTPATMQNFSAVAYFFGRRLQEVLDIPIGLIQSAWGGTPAEVWIPQKAINENPVLLTASKLQKPRLWGPHEPGKTYNAMIAPLVPYKIAGFLYYQGESNVENAHAYADLLDTLIASWREAWNEPLPFYLAQIAPYDYEIPEVGAIVRDAQRRVANQTPHCGLVVTSDIGNVNDIHPMNKLDVGLRFANLALNSHYQQETGLTSGPLFRKAWYNDGQVIAYFENDLELHTSDSQPPTHFELADESGVYHPAIAKVVENTIVLSSAAVKHPTHIRFAWHNTATPNLVNRAKLPASCFQGVVEDGTLLI